MKTIPIFNSELVAIVDDEDYMAYRFFRWYLLKKKHTSYAILDNPAFSPRTQCMHRLIMKATKGKVIDHRNGDGLDNRRENLRLCTQRENNKNRCRSGCNSGFKSVQATHGRYETGITANGRRIYLGRFDTPELAALAYDEAARKFHGEFAALNFARPGERSAITGEIVAQEQHLKTA